MNYFGQWSNLELIRQDGSTRLVADVLHNISYVILLFGAAWSPESEAFIPTISRFYEAHHEKKKFEIIFISRDYNKVDMTRGFLFRERAAVEADRRARQAQKEERARQRSVAEFDTQGHRGDTLRASAVPTSKASTRADVGPTPEMTPGAGSPSPGNSAPSSPPPLKRVAELTIGNAIANSGLGSALAASSSFPLAAEGGGRGFWAVPYDCVRQVGVPLLYHLRVFTYPGVIVCRNRPFPTHIPRTALPLLQPSRRSQPVQLNPSVDTPLGELAASPIAVDPLNSPQRYEVSPRVARPECYPDVVTVSGRFMMELDPDATDFPWSTMNKKTRRAAVVFFVIVSIASAAALSWMLPFFGNKAERAQRKAHRIW